MHMLPWMILLLLALIGLGTLLLSKNIFKVMMGASLLQSAILLLWVLSKSIAPQNGDVAEGSVIVLLTLSSATLLLLLRFAFIISKRYRTADIREMKGHKR